MCILKPSVILIWKNDVKSMPAAEANFGISNRYN